VFRAFTDPELVARWLGPRRLTTKIDEHGRDHGEAWRFVHIDEDGNEFLFRGVIHGTPSVEAGIVRTFEFEGFPGHVSMETARFEPIEGGRTMLRERSVFQSVEDRDGMIESGMESGVIDSMDRLDELLEELKTA
jgi:uncharacterized protein YndB with AHSA1/START domain